MGAGFDESDLLGKENEEYGGVRVPHGSFLSKKKHAASKSWHGIPSCQPLLCARFCWGCLVTLFDKIEIRGDAVLETRPDIPTLEQVEKANREQLAKWYRFLPSGDTKEQRRVLDRIAERFKKLGGMTPELSKKIGF